MSVLYCVTAIYFAGKAINILAVASFDDWETYCKSRIKTTTGAVMLAKVIDLAIVIYMIKSYSSM